MKTQIPTIKEIYFAVSLSDVVFIMLINVKMPTMLAYIYEQDKFRAQLSRV